MARYTRVIVDAMNLAHRAFHTTARELNSGPKDNDYASAVDVANLKAPPGMAYYPTGVLYVCTRFYLAMLRRWIPDQVVFVWDNGSRDTLRRTIYKLYKQSRVDKEATYTDEERERRAAFRTVECRDVRNMVEGFGGINVDAPDLLEADDVI